MMAFEEMAELRMCCVSSCAGAWTATRSPTSPRRLPDVGIMLDQVAIEFEVEDAVAEQRAYKVRRLRERIEKDG